jgi:uncharacterized repeat protein (TIGR01451 family)
LFTLPCSKRLLASAILAALLLMGIPFDVLVASAAETPDLCAAPVRRFPGGPGRRPGATVVVVEMRQEVQDLRGSYVAASSEQNLALLRGDEVAVRLLVKNRSIYDVGRISIKHHYRASRSGPLVQGIASVRGAAYDSSQKMFLIDRLRANQTAEITFRILLKGDLRDGISQTAVTLNEFIALDRSGRFGEPVPEAQNQGSRRALELVGIGAKEVSCFTGDPLDNRVSPGTAANAPRQAFGRGMLPVILPAPSPVRQTRGDLTGALTVRKQAQQNVIRPGSVVNYAITVQNASSATFRQILVDDRFDTNLLAVSEAGGGLPTDSGLHWIIREIGPKSEWSARYTARLTQNAEPGQSIPNTVMLRGDDLRDVPTSSLLSSAEVKVAGGRTEAPGQVVMPQTGWGIVSSLLMILQVAFGVVIAFGLYGAGVWMVWRRV